MESVAGREGAGLEVREGVLLGPLTTFGVGGAARYFAEVWGEAELVEAVSWARERGLRVLPFGGGSNLLVGDRGFDGLAVRLGIGGEMGLREGAGWVEYDVPAGRDWDGFVSEVCRAGLSGVECLAGIPGMTGGTPIQNVGAYGQEVSETIVSVRAFDLQVGEFVEMGAAECGFQYRGSVFNRAERGRYLVTRVRFRFDRGRVPELGYADLRRWFGEGARPSPTEVSEAVREIRAGKGMVVRAGDPDSRSAGSFFKNPVVGGAVLERLAGETGVGAVPHWPGGEEGMVKLSAAWLVERAGFGKGFRMGGAGVSTRHSLALTNWSGRATAAEVYALRDAIRAEVERRFGVWLEQEPVEAESVAVRV